VLLGALGAWRGQRGGGWRLLGGEHVEQRLDLSVAFGDLLEMELVSREVLPQSEQVFLAIVAGQRGGRSAVKVRNSRTGSGSRSGGTATK
jgi:hypothetical protein